MTCPHCFTTRKQTTTLQKEVKFWKERYFIKKKSMSCLTQWILGVFGFTVRVEVDHKESLGIIRIEGRESKEALPTALFPPNNMTDNKITLLMEDRIIPEDFLEDPEEIAGLELAQSVEVNDDDQQNQVHEDGAQIESKVQESCNNGQNDVQAIFDILRNYENSSTGTQPSYIILKDGNNEAIPVHLDYTQFLNREFTTTTASSGSGETNQQILYSLDSSSSSPAMITADLNSANNAKEVGGTVLNIKKTPTTATCIKGKVKRKSQSTKQNKKTKTGQTSSNTSSSATIPHSSSTSMMTVTNDGIMIGEIMDKEDFGLTLREKAQVYVQTKAMEVIQKTSQGSFTCVHCSHGYKFTSVDNALTHALTHFEQTPYKCQLCNATFANQKGYLQHRKCHYPSKRPSSCKTPATTTTKQPVFLSPRANAASPIIPSIKISEPVGMKPPPPSSTKMNSSSNKQQLQNFGVPGPANKNKQFKCKVHGCEWSYANEYELEWHMKWHSEVARV